MGVSGVDGWWCCRKAGGWGEVETKVGNLQSYGGTTVSLSKRMSGDDTRK